MGDYFDMVIIVHGYLYVKIKLRTGQKGGSGVKFEHRSYSDLSNGHCSRIRTIIQGELRGLYTFAGRKPLPERCSNFKEGLRNFGIAVNCIIW